MFYWAVRHLKIDPITYYEMTELQLSVLALNWKAEQDEIKKEQKKAEQKRKNRR